MTDDAHQIFLIDDDEDFREATRELLEDEGLATRTFSDGASMLGALDPEWGGVILCDVRMAGMDGFGVLKRVREAAPDAPFVMITGHGDVRLAISAIKAGAYDFLEKPVQPDVLLSMMRRTLSARKLVIENKRLRRRVELQGGMSSRLIGRSRAMKACRKALLDLAPLPITVMLCGETGTGKSLAAQMLHEFGDAQGAFHTINCATSRAGSLFADLNAVDPETGTLYLRAAHALEQEDQTLLADYLRRSDRPRVVVSITGAQAQCALNEDLYYLVNVASVDMPALRDREKDVFLLLEAFLREAAARYGKRLPTATRETLAPLGRHDWPGNVRELRNVAERMVLGLPAMLERPVADSARAHQSYDEAMAEFERNLLEQTLRETGGRKGDAAALLSIPRKRLYLRLKAVGLLKPGQD